MMVSEAWKKLSSKQKVLYLACKDRLYSQKTKYSPDPNDKTKFYFNRTIWLNDYNLYPTTNEAGFYKDMGALIEYGFIKCIESGATSRTKSIYQYSDKWQLFGTLEFKIMPSEMSGHLLNKKKKENKNVKGVGKLYKYCMEKSNKLIIKKASLLLGKSNKYIYADSPSYLKNRIRLTQPCWKKPIAKF